MNGVLALILVGLCPAALIKLAEKIPEHVRGQSWSPKAKQAWEAAFWGTLVLFIGLGLLVFCGSGSAEETVIHVRLANLADPELPGDAAPAGVRLQNDVGPPAVTNAFGEVRNGFPKHWLRDGARLFATYRGRSVETFVRRDASGFVIVLPWTTEQLATWLPTSHQHLGS